MRFFFDNNLPPRLAKAINALLDPPHAARHLRDDFPPDVGDVEWLAKLGSQGDWIVISADMHITRNAHERKAWQEAKLTTFFLKNWSDQTFWMQAAQLVRWWPDIMAQAQKVKPGAGFLVPFNYRGGRFEQPKLT